MAFNDADVDASIRQILRTVNTFIIDYSVIVGTVNEHGALSPRIECYEPRATAALAVIKTCYRYAFGELRRQHSQRDTILECLFNQAKPGDPRRKVLDQIFGGCGHEFIQAVQVANLGINEARAREYFELAGSAGSGTVLAPSTEAISPRPRLGTPDPLVNNVLGLVRLSESNAFVAEDVVSNECLRLEKIADSDISSIPSVECQVRMGRYNWHVLTLEYYSGDLHAFLLADCLIGSGPYHRSHESVKWQDSDLCRWLNSEFLVSLGEPVWTRVPETRNSGARQPVFLPSVSDLKTYLGNDANGYDPRMICSDDSGRPVSWWLRDAGRTAYDAAVVRDDGSIDHDGYAVTTAIGVRPALWLNVKS
jgi:hypothetical protein